MLEMKGKKLLVIGGASQHCKVVEAAHELGVVVHVADYLPVSPAKTIADVAVLINVFDIDALEDYCEKEGIDGVIATSLDACQIPYQQLCERKGYPCFGTHEQFFSLTNKEAFKAMCKEYGVDTIPSYTEDEVIQDVNVEYPLFIKPADNRGSRGQSICNNRDEALKAITKAKSESESGIALIEKCMKDCADFTVSYLVKDGEPYVVRTGDRYEGVEGSGMENLCIASCSPSKFTEEYLRGPHAKVVSMLKGMGLKNGPVFFQGFRKDGKVYFYDPGLRFAGGEYERLQKKACGIDTIKMLVEFALSGKGSPDTIDDTACLLGGKTTIQLDPTLCPGTIGEISGIEEIMSNPDFVYNSQRYKVGDTLTEGNDLRRRFSEFAILSETKEKEIENVKYLQSKLIIKDTNGQNMIIYPFDSNNLK